MDDGQLEQAVDKASLRPSRRGQSDAPGIQTIASDKKAFVERGQD